MKYLLFTFLSFTVYPILSDLTNWSFYNNKTAHNTSNLSKLKYKGDGVKIYTNNNFDIYYFNPKKVKFGVSSVRPSGKKFYMNSNFFNKRAIGLVVENGVRKSRKVSGGGYFYVSDNKVDIKRGSCPKNIKYASQTILWGIDNGIMNMSLMKKGHAKQLTYRNIVGKNKNGEIIFIVSNFGGVVTIEDVINEGVKQGMVEGILFDGGTSVEYMFNDGNYSTSFTALSDYGKKLMKIDKPTTYIYVN
jgi:uncharacterized protein YigE (DUF2233 family)